MADDQGELLKYDPSQAVEQSRRRHKIWRHPDREYIETMLTTKSAFSVERWLKDRYPIIPDAAPAENARNKALQLPRKTLIEYRDRFLVDPSFREPVEDSPLQKVLPERMPDRSQLYELEGLAKRIEAAEYILAKCLSQDQELGMVQDITLQALAELGRAYKDRLEIASRLGLDGYQEAVRRVSVDQRVQSETLQVNVDGGTHGTRQPRDPMKYDLGRMLLSLGDEERKALLALPSMPNRDEVLQDAEFEELDLPSLREVVNGVTDSDNIEKDDERDESQIHRGDGVAGGE